MCEPAQTTCRSARLQVKNPGRSNMLPNLTKKEIFFNNTAGNNRFIQVKKDNIPTDDL